MKDWIIMLTVAIVFACIAGLIVYWIKVDNDEWTRFVTDNHCTPTDQRRNDVRWVLSGKILVPLNVVRVGYVCDDDNMYWR